MANNNSLHEHGVCSFVESELFRFLLPIIIMLILPAGAGWLAELIRIILSYMMKAYCPYRE